MGDDGRSDVMFWEHLGIKRGESKDKIDEYDAGTTQTCLWVYSDIDVMLEHIGD